MYGAPEVRNETMQGVKAWRETCKRKNKTLMRCWLSAPFLFFRTGPSSVWISPTCVQVSTMKIHQAASAWCGPPTHNSPSKDPPPSYVGTLLFVPLHSLSHS